MKMVVFWDIAPCRVVDNEVKWVGCIYWLGIPECIVDGYVPQSAS